MKKKINKKRGAGFLELVIAVAMVGIFVALVGPMLRYYLKLGQNYNNKTLEKVELGAAFNKLEELIGSITVTDKNSQSRNSGTAVRTYTEYTQPTDENEHVTLSVSLTKIKGEVMKSNGSTQGKIIGNTLIILIPAMSKEGDKLVEAYHIFRFLEESGNMILYYANNLEDGYPVIMSKSGNSQVEFKEKQYLPSGTAIKKLGLGSKFIEVDGGVIMRLEYQDSLGKSVAVEKLFLKRGEV